MKKTLQSLLVVLLCWSLPAFATPFSPLNVGTEIPGLRQPFSGITYNHARRLLNNLVAAFGKRVDLKPGVPLTEAEVECAMAQLSTAFVQTLMLGDIPGVPTDDLKAFPDALAHFRAREEYWCRPPPGGPNKGAELVRLWTIRVTEGTPQAKTLTETYASRAAKYRWPNVTPKDMAVAVAIALAVAAGELQPLPIP
ncbi:hypothetical protein [Corallococcus silvisoli]|uniref:hypothetical protein n=1 Tax=Corallococcus silvisoli TaxID=2697031 RepID=UPI001377671C|nr:hypothetical protein [Corallococcus silvisoli]NBD11853.1 hypothetical protein [Corallococcus silvisoli]